MKLTYIANARIPTEKAHGVQIMKMCEAFSELRVKSTKLKVELVIPKRLNNIKEDPYTYYGVKHNFRIKKLPCLDLVRFGKIGFYIQSLTFSISSFFYIIFKKPKIIYSRDELPLYFLSFFKKNIFWETHTPKWNFASKRILNNSNRVISITHGLKNFYIKKGVKPEHILVAPDGVDLKNFDIKISKKKLKLPQDKKIISYVGKYKTMGIGKGVDTLIESFQYIVKSTPNAFLLIVGINNDEIDEIRKIFKNLKINKNNYKIITHVSRNEVVYYLKSSDILVMNYPKKEHYEKYMSPLKLFEYMASGIPIVTSDLQSIREILNENNSVLVDSDNPNSITDGILKVLTNENLANKISIQSLLDIKNYTWSKRVQNILEFIK